jgi:hypothetical protein
MAMTPDKTTKVVLVVIALGLWANAIPCLIRPVQAQPNHAAQPHYSDVLVPIRGDLSKIEDGFCSNSTICGRINERLDAVGRR